MSNVRLSRQHATKLAGFSAAVLIALAGGCGGENESLKQIEKAEQSVSALTADGTFASLADGYKRTELVKIHDSMNALAGSGPETVRAAAFSIAARAKAGIASLDSKAAVEADRELESHLADLRFGLNTFTLQKSIAEANTGAGTQDLIKTLQASLETNKKNAADASKAASKIQATVDELNTRVKAITAQATAKREEATSIEARIQGVSATEGLEVLKRAAAVRAESNLLEQQAANLSTQLGLSQAELARARSTASAFEEQSKQLQREIAGAQTKLEEERKLADAAGKAASDAASAISKKFADLTAFRSSKLDTAHQAAVSSAQKAVELAKQATAKAGPNPLSVAAGNSGKLSTASMQQIYADALVNQARSQGVIAGTLGLLAGAKPAVPNAAEFTAAAEAARKTSDDTLTQAREIYGQIKDSLDGIADEKLKTRIAETSRLLQGLSSKQGVMPDAPAAQPSSPSTTAAPAPDGATADVRKIIDQFQDKVRANDMRGTADLFDFESDAQRDAYVGMMDFGTAFAALDSACQEKFGKPFSQIMGGQAAAMAAMMPDPEVARSRTSADFNITVSGDTATVSPKQPAGPMDAPMTLRKKDNTWKISAEGVALGGPTGGMFKMLTPVFKTLAADVKSGKFESPEQFKTTITAQLGSMFGGGLKPPAGDPGEDDPNK